MHQVVSQNGSLCEPKTFEYMCAKPAMVLMQVSPNVTAAEAPEQLSGTTATTGQLGVPLTVYPWYLYIELSRDSWGL